MPHVTRRALSTLTALIMVGTLFVGAPGPVRAAADVYIGYAADTSSANCTDPAFTADGSNDSAQIMLAVAATTAGGTLHFCPGTYDIDTTIDLSGTDITLQGAAATTTILDGNDGGGATRILASSGAITVSDLTFQDGLSAGDAGGAINANTATVTGSTFENNTAFIGGAIRADTATVTDSTFTNNTADYGGAIFANTTATVTASTFTNNDATYWGGAIFATDATVTASTFTGNTATYGGAIRAATATVTASTFTDNTADYGGAIYATTAIVTNSTFTDNDAGSEGGAIYAYTTATVTASTFTGNTSSGAGDDVYASDGGTVCGDVRGGPSVPGIWDDACANATFSVDVIFAGTGSGSVADGAEGTLDCDEVDATCTETYASGTTVTLTATAAEGSTFESWDGMGDEVDCDDALGTCTFTSIAAAKAVTAIFNTSGGGGGGGGGGGSSDYSLSVTTPRFGTITSSDGFSCAPTDVSCELVASQGSELLLSSSAQPGYTHVRWNGCTSVSAGICSVTLNADTAISANYGTRWLTRFVGTGATLRASAAAAVRAAATALSSLGTGDTITITGYGKTAGAKALARANALASALRAAGVTAPITITTAASSATPAKRAKATIRVVWGVTP